MSKVYLVHLFYILIKAHNSVHEITKAKGSSIEVMCFNEGSNEVSKEVSCDDMNKEKIMSYILQEKSNKEIAELCNVSVRTVERHRKKVKEATSDNDKKSDKKTTTTTNKRSKIDWLKLETEYVTDISEKPVTLKDLSEKYEVSYKTIEDYSSKNGWKEKRI